MELSSLVMDRISKYYSIYQEYRSSPEYQEDLSARKVRQKNIQRLLAKPQLERMTELEFGQLLGSLWALQMWGNVGYLVESFIEDNQSLEQIKKQLILLIYGSADIVLRYDLFKKSTKGFGMATVSEILAFLNPDQYGIWNSQTRKALSFLGLQSQIPFLKKSQITGKQYEQYLDVLNLLKVEIESIESIEIDLLGMNYFLFEVANRPDIILEQDHLPGEVFMDEAEMDDFDHDEAIDNLVAIGAWLGFASEKEKQIAKGAVVDAIWQAKIANLGVVTYVFEVQRRGSIDSLIVNLQKAQNNPSVQRLVVVAFREKITEVKEEISSLPESFRNSVSYLDVVELYRAFDLLNEFSAIIDKLDLVRSEFDFNIQK
ncbi:MAG TPA: hypothetical protein ENF22_02785 [Chloroflexi bacterium]|nr:hypothetical protein [Chloroflexota bacterium]